MLRITLALLGLSTVAPLATAQSYDYSYACASNYVCPANYPETAAKTHVFCQPPYGFASSCVTPEFVPSTDGLRALYLSEHNARRSIVALGQLSGPFYGKQAKWTAELAWSDELEMYAQKALLGCSTTKDLCHKTLKFLYPGQNMGYACASSPEEAIKTVIANWWNQNTNVYAVDMYTYLDSVKTNGPYTEFIQMILGTDSRIGCATVATQCKTCYYVSCNYATRAFLERELYYVDTTFGQCSTYSATYAGLCGIDDVFYGASETYGNPLFSNDNTVPATVQTFIANGRVLFASPTDPSCLPFVPTVATPTTPTTPTTQTTQPSGTTASSVSTQSTATVSTVSTGSDVSTKPITSVTFITTNTTATSITSNASGSPVSSASTGSSDSNTISTQTISPITNTASSNSSNSGNYGSSSITEIPVYAVICKKQENCRHFSKSDRKTDVKAGNQEENKNERKRKSKSLNGSKSKGQNKERPLCKVLHRDGNQITYKKCRSSHGNTKKNNVKLVKYQIFPKQQSHFEENIKGLLPLTSNKYKIFP